MPSYLIKRKGSKASKVRYYAMRLMTKLGGLCPKNGREILTAVRCYSQHSDTVHNFTVLQIHTPLMCPQISSRTESIYSSPDIQPKYSRNILS